MVGVSPGASIIYPTTVPINPINQQINPGNHNNYYPNNYNSNYNYSNETPLQPPSYAELMANGQPIYKKNGDEPLPVLPESAFKKM